VNNLVSNGHHHRAVLTAHKARNNDPRQDRMAANGHRDRLHLRTYGITLECCAAGLQTHALISILSAGRSLIPHINPLNMY
jgi:hypothetical protein